MKYLLCLLAALSISRLPAATREEMRKDAEKLVKEEKYDSARLALERIAEAAAAEKSWAEAARAHAEAFLLEAVIRSDEPALRLTRMDALLAKAPAELRPMLLAVLASWWHDYFERHRWELIRRTQTENDSSGDDIAAWDLQRVLNEVDARFTKALANAAELKRTPIAQWNGLLVQGGISDSYQPTLYDFIARQALKFHASAVQAAAEVKAENAFRFDAQSPALGSMELFLAWKPQAAGPKAKVIQLYQSLLAFHKDDADPGARVLLDAERLTWPSAAALER